MGEREGQPELDLGHRGAGDDCMAQMVKYGGGAAVAGAAYGTVEGCFIKQVPNSTMPMMMRAFGVIVSRSVLVGAAGGAFAAGACMTARFRDKDDYVNAAVGGLLSGAVFGLKYRMWSVALGLAAGIGLVMGSMKYRHGDYLPDFPTPQTAANLHTQNTSDRE